jgi:hypothetical protein
MVVYLCNSSYMGGGTGKRITVDADLRQNMGDTV